MPGDNEGDPTKNAQPVSCPTTFQASVMYGEDGAQIYRIETELTLPKTPRAPCFLECIHQWVGYMLVEKIVDSYPSVCDACPLREECDRREYDKTPGGEDG